MAVPVVTSVAATGITFNSATLKGTVNPTSLATTYHFEYGETTDYGFATDTFSAGEGAAAIAVEATVIPFEALTTYHYKLVATNSSGTVSSDDVSFTTLSAETAAQVLATEVLTELRSLRTKGRAEFSEEVRFNKLLKGWEDRLAAIVLAEP